MGNIIVAVLAAALIVGIIVFAVTKIKRGKQTKCKKCKTRYNFDTDVSYEIIGTVSARNGTDKKSGIEMQMLQMRRRESFYKAVPFATHKRRQQGCEFKRGKRDTRVF